MIAAAPPAMTATALYPAGVKVSPAGLSLVTADPHGNKAALAARAALVASRNFKHGDSQHTHFLVRAYNPHTGDVFIQHESGSAVHCVNRVTGKCDCEDATKGQTKRLRLACTEAGLNPDALPVDDGPEALGALFCKHYWILGAVLTSVFRSGQSVESVLCQFPAELPRTYWALCPSKKTDRRFEG